MEEGQNKKFLSKSSIGNAEFMTNIVEKKPNIFKRLAAKFSSGNKNKIKTPKKPASSMPSVPEVAPGAAPKPKVAEPKNSAPIILIKPDRQNPFASLKAKFDSLPNKKPIIIVIIIIIALLILIPITVLLVPKIGNSGGSGSNGGGPGSSSSDIPPLENTIDSGRGGNKYEGNDATSMEVNDLQSRVNSYAAASPEIRQNAEEYKNLEQELTSILPRIEQERGTRDTVNYILTTISLGRYYEANGNKDKFLELYDNAISGTTNETALAYYYSNLCRFYQYNNDPASEKTCIAKLLEIDDSEVQLFTLEDWGETKAKFRSRYNEL